MKTEFQAKYLQHLASKKKKDEGFTLIELLVVVVMIGVLAAIAMPNLLGQVGKARDSEMKNAVGAINRGQQAYNTEKQAFAGGTTAAVLGKLGIALPIGKANSNITSLESLPIADVDNKAGETTVAAVQSKNTDFATDGTRAYSGRISYNDGDMNLTMCQSNAKAETVVVPTGDGSCNTTVSKLVQ